MHPYKRFFWELFFPAPIVDGPDFYQHLRWFLTTIIWESGLLIGMMATGSLVITVLLARPKLRSGHPLRFSTPQLWLFGIVYIYWVGGSTGVMLANAEAGRSFHENYFLIGHFEYVAQIATFFAVFGIWYYIVSKFTLYQYNKHSSQTHFWMTFVGTNMILLPQIYVGLAVKPPNFEDFPSAFAKANLVSNLGIYVIAVATIFFVIITMRAYFISRNSTI